jgi:hypothetical protein
MTTSASYKGYLPPDLQKTDAGAATAATETSSGSFDKIIRLPLVKNKKYKFWFTYVYEDAETKKLTEGPRSPIVESAFDIPNLTKPVLNLTLTASYRAYGVKFDIDPLSVQEDIVIFESLTGLFSGEEYIVYVGTSTNVTIQTGSTAPRWVKVTVRDKWLDVNRSSVTAGPVTPLNPDPDTTYTVENPTTTSASASIDPKDLSGFSLVSTMTWAVSADTKTAGYAIRWSTTNPTSGTPLWEYASVDGRTNNTFTATGLIPNTTYYYQVAAVTPYDVVNWTSPASSTFIASDADGTAAGALARLKSFIAIGGVSQDLFKIGTGIAQSINLNTDPLVSPTLTAGTYHGILLNKSTTNVGNNFWLTTGQFRVGNSTEFMYWNGTNLYLTGNINATGGKFTGNVQLAIPTGGTTSGTLYAGASPDTGARLRFNNQGLYAYDGISSDASVAITNVGVIDARKGFIGGWTINATSQTSGTISRNNTILDSNGNITVGDTTGTLGSAVRLSATDPTYRIWVGSTSSSNAPFRVDATGKLYATGAVFTSSSIDGYASTAALGNYTLTSVTTGINSRLTNVEGNYVNVSTLNSSVATKNTTFVTADSTQPYANKAGDLWINGGDNNSIWTANSAGYNWTEKTNGKYATVTSLNSKLSAGGYAIAAQDGQVTNITSNGIFITPGTFKISNTNESAPYSGSYLLLNSAGMTAYDGSKTTFAISSSGSATFSGNISGSSFSGGSIVIGSDETSTGYINTQATKAGVTTMVIKAIGHASTSNSGWTTSCYPWSDNTNSLGIDTYSWANLYVGNSYFNNGTTYKITGGDAYLNGYAVSGGYGIYSHWAPRSDNTYDLGGWSLSSTGIQQNKRWRQIYSNNSAIVTSDARLKTNVSDSELGLNFINKLRPVTYKWIEGGKEPILEDKEIKHFGRDGIEVTKTEIVKSQKISGKDEDGNDIYESISIPGKRRHAGFLAQEVKQVLDELEIEDFGGWVSDNVEDTEAIQSLRYEQFIAPLTKAVQELSNMVESLQEEINTLKGV